MAQLNDLIVTGAARFVNTIKGTIENATKATQDSDGNAINTTYMKKNNVVLPTTASSTSNAIWIEY